MMNEVQITTEQIGELTVETRTGILRTLNFSHGSYKLGSLQWEPRASRFDFFLSCFGFEAARMEVVAQAVAIARRKVAEWMKGTPGELRGKSDG